MFLVTGTNGFLQPFVPLYILASGLNRSQYGVVIALGTGVALLIQPILGKLSDKYDTRRPFIVAAAALAGAAYLCYTGANTMGLFILLTAIGVNGFGYLNAVGGVLVGRLKQEQGKGGATYIKYRVWGSVGYIVIGLTTAFLLNNRPVNAPALSRAGLDPVFHYGPLLFFVIAVVALFVPDARRITPPPAPPRSGEGSLVNESGVSNKAVVGSGDSSEVSVLPSPLWGAGYLRSRWRGGVIIGRRGLPSLATLTNLDRFLVAFFLYQFALYGASAYLALYMKSLGAPPHWITAMFAAGVVSEVLVMTSVGRLTDKYGRRPALALALLLMPLRLLLYIPATGPLWVLLVQTLHGLNFGIVGTIAIVFVNDTATDANRGRLQARLAAAGGLGTALGPVACGAISQNYGLPAMFACMSVVGFMAFAVFWKWVKESHPAPVALPQKWRWLA